MRFLFAQRYITDTLILEGVPSQTRKAFKSLDGNSGEEIMGSFWAVASTFPWLRIAESFALFRIGLVSCAIYAGLIFVSTIAYVIVNWPSGGVAITVSRTGMYLILGIFWFLSTSAALLLFRPQH